jgi:hypothetical protein
MTEENLKRTSNGDSLLVLCQTDPENSVVLKWIADVRASDPMWEVRTDKEILDFTILVLSQSVGSRLGLS